MLLILLNVIDHGMGMQEAVNAKRVHHQWYPDEIRVKTDALINIVQTDLEQLGHQLRMTDKIGRRIVFWYSLTGIWKEAQTHEVIIPLLAIDC